MTLEEAVNKLFEQFSDIRDHLPTLYSLAKSVYCGVIVELGAGHSTYILTKAAKEGNSQFYSIDQMEEAHLREFPEGAGIVQREKNYFFVKGDDSEIVKEWETKIDLLLIDSDHDYLHVYDTLVAWTPKVHVYGTICMHDTDHTWGHATGVLPALEKFLSEHPGQYSVTHRKGCGGFSILTKLKEE